ncbi:MAG: tetratricopeptide repeat protein [Polyangiaceae bacterium]
MMRPRVLRLVRPFVLSVAFATVSGYGFAQGAALDAATPAQKKAAQKAFLKGADASSKGKHEEAMAAFKESYDAVASPNPHLMYARELVALGRFADAYEEFDKVIPEAQAAAKTDDKYAQTAEAAHKDMTDLESKIALVSVIGVNDGDILRVGGKEIPRESWGRPIPVMPGSVKVEVATSTGQESSKDVDAQAGSRPVVDMAPAVAEPTPTEKPESGTEVSTDSSKWDKRTWAYVAGGVGVAGLVTFGVFGALANAKHSKLEDECTNGVCPKSLEGDKDTGQTYQTVANVGLVVGIVGLGTGTALYLMSDDKKEKQARKEPPKPSVNVGVGYQSVTVFGSF